MNTADAMNAIEQAKRTLSDGLIFKFSTIGFALKSALCYTNRINVGNHDHAEYAAQVRDGDSIFISTRESRVNIDTIVSILLARNVRVFFYLLEEPLVAWSTVERLLPVSIRIFVQNNAYDHPKVGIMPIGIRDCGSVVLGHRGFYHKTLLEKGGSIRTMPGGDARPIKCLLCFTLCTHPSRKQCYDLFSSPDASSWCCNLNIIPEIVPTNLWGMVPTKIFYDKTLESRYALCPRGCGVDTHRFYESIYLGCIPIVTRTNTTFDRIYSVFPCLIVERWEDVTEELLDRMYPECFARLCEFHEKYPRFLTDTETIERLMEVL